MQNVVGVRFQEAGKIYYFSPAGFEQIEVGEYVVVETSRGLEISRVVIAPHQVVNAELSETLKPIVRMAYQEDIERMEIFRAKAEQDVAVVRAAVQRLDLPMKVVSGTYNLDGTRLTVYFNPAGESRVDLRDLLKVVQADLDVMVQLRQVGPRDQAKAVGGYGICGRRLCCSAWLTAFPAISIKMAKEQNQPLNPSKISGQCGRLLCCLAYENDMYKQLKAELPRVGTAVSTPAGDARVVGVNALRQVVSLQMANFQVIEMPASALAMDRGVVRIIEEPEDEKAAAAVAAIAAPPPPAPPARRERDAGPPPERPRLERPRPTPSRPEAERREAERPEPRDRGPRDRRPGGPPPRRPQPDLPVGVGDIEHQREPVVASEPQVSPPAEDGPEGPGGRKRRRRRGGRRSGDGGGQGPVSPVT